MNDSEFQRFEKHKNASPIRGKAAFGRYVIGLGLDVLEATKKKGATA